MRQSLISLFLSSLLIGCANLKQSSGLGTISIGDGDSETLNIEEQVNSTYGPEYIGDSEVNSDSKNKNHVHSLSIYSTLYSTLGMVQFLKAAERKNIYFSTLTSNGFGSLISVLYAKKKSSNYLEWKLFDLLKKIKDEVPFQKRWKSTIRKFLKEEFGNQQLQQLKLLVVVPKIVGGEVKLISVGSIVDTVMGALELDHKSNLYLKPSAFKSRFSSYGTDTHLSIAFIADDFRFRNLSGYEWGIYTNYLSFLNSKSHLYRPIKAKDIQFIDEILALSDITHSYEDGIEKALQFYIDEISTTENTTGLEQ